MLFPKFIQGCNIKNRTWISDFLIDGFIHTASVDHPSPPSLGPHKFPRFPEDLGFDCSWHDGWWEMAWVCGNEGKVCAPSAFPLHYVCLLNGDAYLFSLANVLLAVLIPLTDRKAAILVLTPLTCLLTYPSPYPNVLLGTLWIQWPTVGGLCSLFPVLIWYNWSWKRQLGTINYSFSIKYLTTTETKKNLNALI